MALITINQQKLTTEQVIQCGNVAILQVNVNQSAKNDSVSHKNYTDQLKWSKKTGTETIVWSDRKWNNTVEGDLVAFCTGAQTPVSNSAGHVEYREVIAVSSPNNRPSTWGPAFAERNVLTLGGVVHKSTLTEMRQVLGHKVENSGQWAGTHSMLKTNRTVIKR